MDWRVQVQDWLRENERSQGYLAGRAGITRPYLNLCLLGKEQPREPVLHALESAMGLDHGALGKAL